MGLVLPRGVEIVDRVAVGDHQGLIAPFVTEYVLEKPVARAARHPFVAMIRAHHLLHVGLGHKGLECRKIGLPQVAPRHTDVESVPQGFRPAVHPEVLRAGVGLEVPVVIALHPLDGLHPDDFRQIRIFPGCLLAAPPAGIAEDVDVRAPEAQFGVAGVIPGTHPDIEFRGGTVPVGPGLIGDAAEHLVYKVGVERGGKTDILRVDSVPVGPDAVAGLAPPVVGRDSEPVHGDRLVHHQPHLLLRSQQGKQVLHPLLYRERRVSERILILVSATASGSHQKRSRKSRKHLGLHKIQCLYINSLYGLFGSLVKISRVSASLPVRTLTSRTEPGGSTVPGFRFESAPPRTAWITRGDVPSL